MYRQKSFQQITVPQYTISSRRECAHFGCRLTNHITRQQCERGCRNWPECIGFAWSRGGRVWAVWPRGVSGARLPLDPFDTPNVVMNAVEALNIIILAKSWCEDVCFQKVVSISSHTFYITHSALYTYLNINIQQIWFPNHWIEVFITILDEGVGLSARLLIVVHHADKLPCGNVGLVQPSCWCMVIFRFRYVSVSDYGAFENV